MGNKACDETDANGTCYTEDDITKGKKEAASNQGCSNPTYCENGRPKSPSGNLEDFAQGGDTTTKEPKLPAHPSSGRPPCKDIKSCESDAALMIFELVHLIAFDLLMLILIGEAIGAGPAGWVGLALVSPIIVAFYYRTWQVIQEIREFYEWRDYYNKANP